MTRHDRLDTLQRLWRRCLPFAVLLSAVIAPTAARAQPAPPEPRFTLNIPVFDVPYNTTNGGRAPSMAQSLALSVDFYELSHDAIRRAWSDRKWPTRLSIIAWDFFSTLAIPLPGSESWMHEEFHRATLGRRGISSFNDVYRFNPNAPLYVSQVTDDALIALKRDHPAELVRASAAGLEGDYLLVESLQRHAFFGKSSNWHLPLYVGVKIASAGYLWSGTQDFVNRNIDASNFAESTQVDRRDFTGHDMTAWVYDLYRPDEPYVARGIHPSGVGIDRYIKPEDLAPEELRYLKEQSRLQLINFLDPAVIRPRGFVVTNPINKRPMRVMARGGHVLTPFGYSIDADVMLQQDRVGLAAVLHTYVNKNRTSPGLDVTVVDYPIAHSFTVSPRGALWIQPDDLRFDTTQLRFGGLVGVRIERRSARGLAAYIEIEGKTSGWVAGNEYLGANVSATIGMSVTVK